MMRFRKSMYIAPSVRNPRKIKWKLRTGRGSLDIYVMVLNHDSGKLEYFHNGMLKQKILHNRDMDIVGLAGTTGECIELIERMTADAHDITGQYDIYRYLMQV